MTLIATYITREGIIHAADSYVTNDNSTDAPKIRSKVFEVPHVNAGCCLCGPYWVGRERFDRWIADLIDESAQQDTTIGAFSERLRGRLQSDMARDQKYDGGCLVYVGGVVADEGGSHPEIYAVRNMELDPKTGDYCNEGDLFACDEQFWTRDYKKLPLGPGLAGGDHVAYVNGFLPGRRVYLALDNVLSRFFEQVRANAALTFRRPGGLEERVGLIKAQMTLLCELMKASDYQPYVGGDIQTLLIPTPNGRPWV